VVARNELRVDPLKKTILVVGGTSAIALAAVREWLKKEEVRIVLLGRDHQRLQRIQNDLNLRHAGASIEIEATQIASTSDIITDASSIFQRYTPDIILIAHGNLPTQFTIQESLKEVADSIQINGTSCVLWMEAAAHYFQLRGAGSLAVIGSVAGDRGRQSNYIYGASKAFIACYAEGLQHRFAGSQIKVTLIKPGPTESPMTEHLKASGLRLAKVDTVGKDIVQAIDRGIPILYTPKIWRFIMLIIRHLPRFIMHKTRL